MLQHPINTRFVCLSYLVAALKSNFCAFTSTKFEFLDRGVCSLRQRGRKISSITKSRRIARESRWREQDAIRRAQPLDPRRETPQTSMFLPPKMRSLTKANFTQIPSFLKHTRRSFRPKILEKYRPVLTWWQ